MLSQLYDSHRIMMLFTPVSHTSPILYAQQHNKCCRHLFVMDVVSCKVSILDLRGCDKATDACISSLGHGCGELQSINLRS